MLQDGCAAGQFKCLTQQRNSLVQSYLVPLSNTIVFLEKLLVTGDAVLSEYPAVRHLVSLAPGFKVVFGRDIRPQLTYPAILKV
jgi:hypothetical protein